MEKLAIKIRYNGANYHGWQRQKRDISVQETLENALEALWGVPIKTVGCGRTDAGVHALKYCVSFWGETNIPLDRLPLALNAHLPGDIVVLGACAVEPDFNAINSCIKKEYTYQILNSPLRDPFMAPVSYFYPKKLDLARLEAAAACFVGTHDFKAMRSVGTVTKTTVRTVHHCMVETQGDLVKIKICADGFLYNMARAIVGTLLYVAQGKIEPGEIGALLKAGDRRLAGPTAPPQGLALSEIWYDGPVGEMMKDSLG